MQTLQLLAGQRDIPITKYMCTGQAQYGPCVIGDADHSTIQTGGYVNMVQWSASPIRESQRWKMRNFSPVGFLCLTVL